MFTRVDSGSRPFRALSQYDRIFVQVWPNQCRSDPSGNPFPKKGGLREYLVLPQAFRNELCAGFDFRFAVRVLKEHQWLIPGNDKTAQVIRVPGLGPTRVYVVGTKLWEDG